MTSKNLANLTLPVALLTAMFWSVPTEAATLEGTWRGSGHVNPKDGKREKVSCRITYGRQTPKVFSVRAVCATSSAKIHQTGEVLLVRNNRYVGDFYNPEFDVSGRVRVTISGSRQTVTFSGAQGSGSVTLTKQ